MALTVAEIVRGQLGNKAAVVAQVTFDSSYPTGGESFTPADVGMVEFDKVICSPASDGTNAVVCHYDEAEQKIQAFETASAVSAPFDEKGSTESLASYECVVICIGAGN